MSWCRVNKRALVATTLLKLPHVDHNSSISLILILANDYAPLSLHEVAALEISYSLVTLFVYIVCAPYFVVLVYACDIVCVHFERFLTF